MKHQYIDTQAALTKCVLHLEGQPEFSIDLEFDKNRYRYGFNLCLVQIATSAQCYLIDPLVNDVDVRILFPILENPDIQKVCYVFGEDLRLLYSLGCRPKNLYDLSVAGKLLNYPPVSLSALLLDLLKIETSKSSQKSNWFQRPLSEEQIEYAAEDVLYLKKLKDFLQKDSLQKSRCTWIDEENSKLDALDYNGEHEKLIKDKDQKGLTAFQWFYFKKFMFFRESLAEEFDKPSYQIIRREDLLEIIKSPTPLDAWKNTRGKHRKLDQPVYLKKLDSFIAEVEQEALDQNISKSQPARTALDPEAYRALKIARKRADRLKAECFKPIQILIAENYGTHAAPFILGNKLVDELIEGNTQNLREYKRRVIQESADYLGIEISKFLNLK